MSGDDIWISYFETEGFFPQSEAVTAACISTGGMTMNKVWLGIALVTLTLSAFARPINPYSGASLSDAEMQLIIHDESDDFAQDGAEAAATRSWSCVAVDALGRRFTGSSFVYGQARRAALMICETSRHEPRERGCAIESCAPAGEEENETVSSPSNTYS